MPSNDARSQSDQHIEVEKLRRRAIGMRLADVLSRISSTPKPRWCKEKEDIRSKTIMQPPGLDKWTPIDLDPLLIDTTDDYFLYNNGVPACWPIDTAIALPDGKGGVRLISMKTVNAKSIRGKATRFSAYNSECYLMDISQYGEMTNWGGQLLGLFGANWVNLVGHKVPLTSQDNPISNAPKIMLGAALRHRYEWSAIFQFPSGISLRFGSNGPGCLELFNDRDRDGESRRRALLHWVRKHWRRGHQSETLSEVRKHLRGITTFNWRGLDTTVIPAEFELEQGAKP